MRDSAVDVVAPDAAVVAPLRIDPAVAARAPAASASTLRALLVAPPMDARGGGAQYVPMLCYDGAARRVVPSPRCAALVPAAAAVTFPSGATARIARRAALPCAYSAAYDTEAWRPTRAQPGQPGLVLDGPAEARELFTLWPAGVAWSFPFDEAAAALPDRFDALPEAERDALRAVTHAPADASPEVLQLVSVDLDGDGALELLMYVPGNDFSEYSLWRREGDAWRSLGSSNCP